MIGLKDHDVLHAELMSVYDPDVDPDWHWVLAITAVSRWQRAKLLAIDSVHSGHAAPRTTRCYAAATRQLVPLRNNLALIIGDGNRVRPYLADVPDCEPLSLPGDGR